MARKISPPLEVENFGNVNVKTNGSFLRELKLLWGNKTLGATKAVESYCYIRKYMASRFMDLFSSEETLLLVNSFSVSFSENISLLAAKKFMLDTLLTKTNHVTCINKIKNLSDLEFAYLLLELERINTIRKYKQSDPNYLSFIEPSS